MKRDLYFFSFAYVKQKKSARIESKLNAKRESWIWLNEEWTCFIYTITRCSVIYTYRLVMINMQQYDLIQHFIQNIKWSLIFRLILVHSLCARVCARVCVCAKSTEHTEMYERLNRLSFCSTTKQKIIIVLCLRIVFALRTYSPFLRRAKGN